MNYKVFIIFSMTFLFCCNTDKKSESLTDRNLIIPGDYAEGIHIGDIINGDQFKIYPSESDIGQLTEIKFLSRIKFDSIVYINKSSVLFINKMSVVAISGLDIEKKITSDAVILSKGVDNFIFNYGNDGLFKHTSKNHIAYIYQKIGIVIFDDNNDKTIDMFLVFKPDHAI